MKIIYELKYFLLVFTILLINKKCEKKKKRGRERKTKIIGK